MTDSKSKRDQMTAAYMDYCNNQAFKRAMRTEISDSHVKQLEDMRKDRDRWRELCARMAEVVEHAKMEHEVSCALVMDALADHEKARDEEKE